MVKAITEADVRNEEFTSVPFKKNSQRQATVCNCSVVPTLER